MGNGVSSSSSNEAIRINVPVDQEETLWNRSNSDGCLLDTLNSSKTKADLLEQQIDEYRDLLGVAEENYNQSLAEADRYKKQLAATESSNLELLDRIEMMQDEMSDLQRQVESNSSANLSRQLIQKDHEIDRLHVIVEKLTRDVKTVKCKAKEKLRTLRTSLAESKQESSLEIYRLNEQVKTLEGEKESLLAEKQRRPSLSNNNEDPQNLEQEGNVDPRNHLIVELSSQVQLQETLIEDLKEKLNIGSSEMKNPPEETTKKAWRSSSAGESKRTGGLHGSSKRSSSGYGRVTLEKGPVDFGRSRTESVPGDGNSQNFKRSEEGTEDGQFKSYDNGTETRSARTKKQTARSRRKSAKKVDRDMPIDDELPSTWSRISRNKDSFSHVGTSDITASNV